MYSIIATVPNGGEKNPYDLFMEKYLSTVVGGSEEKAKIVYKNFIVNKLFYQLQDPKNSRPLENSIRATRKEIQRYIDVEAKMANYEGAEKLFCQEILTVYDLFIEEMWGEALPSSKRRRGGGDRVDCIFQ